MSNDKQSLLERLQMLCGLEQLSDLRFSECVCRDVIAQEISRIEVQEFTLEQWNDALSYLTSLPKQKDSEMAKALLIKRLGKRCH
jgi:hypothetical protein